MTAIRLSIGAQLEPGAVNILAPFLAAVQRARASIAAESRGLGQDIAKGYRDAPVQARKAFGDAAKAAEEGHARVTASARRAAAEQTAAAEHAYQIKVRYFEREAAAAEASMRRQQAVVRSVLRGGASNALGLARGAVGVAGQIARGAGVNLDVGSVVQRSVEVEKRATDLSNAAYMPGAAGAAGKRQDPAALINESRAVADAVALDTSKALEGLQAFVGKTGDLETGRAIFKELAVLSRATGTELNDMVSAAGDVSLAFGDTEGKAQKTVAVMRSIAGQGKLGAVEIKDLAVQMAKIAAQAPQFEGKIEDTFAILGAFAQEARQRGGAASAAQAANSVSGLVQTFKTPARNKAFAAEGIDVFDKKTGMVRNPQKIVEEALMKAGMDPVRFKKMFANVQGARSVEGFASIYRQAGGGETGIAAVRAEFDRLKKAAIGQGETAESFARSMGGTEAKVQLFNNQLDRIAASTLPQLIPALEKLAPLVVQSVDAFAKFATFAANHPGAIITAAIVASIGKAALGEVVGKAIASAVTGGFGGRVGGGTMGAVGLGVGLGILGGVAGTAYMESQTAKGTGQSAQNVDDVHALMLRAAKEKRATGGLSEDTRGQLSRAQELIKRQTAEGRSMPDDSTLGGKASRIGSVIFGSKTTSDIARENENRDRLPQLEQMQSNIGQLLEKSQVKPDQIKSAMAQALSTTTVKVKVEGGGLGPTPGTTTGPTPVR